MNRVIKSNWMGIVIVSSTGDGFSQEVMQILATESAITGRKGGGLK